MSEGLVHPLGEFCCAVRPSHEWLLSGFLPLRASGAGLKAACLCQKAGTRPSSLDHLACPPPQTAAAPQLVHSAVSQARCKCGCCRAGSRHLWLGLNSPRTDGHPPSDRPVALTPPLSGALHLPEAKQKILKLIITGTLEWSLRTRPQEPLFSHLCTLAGALPAAEGLPEGAPAPGAGAGEEVLGEGCRAGGQQAHPAQALHRHGQGPPAQPHPHVGEGPMCSLCDALSLQSGQMAAVAGWVCLLSLALRLSLIGAASLARASSQCSRAMHHGSVSLSCMSLGDTIAKDCEWILAHEGQIVSCVARINVKVSAWAITGSCQWGAANIRCVPANTVVTTA